MSRVALLLVAAAALVAAPRAQTPPPSPAQAYYHPDAPRLYESLDEYLRWYAARPDAAHRYDAQPDASLRAGAEPSIRAEAVRVGADRALGIDAAALPFQELRPQFARYFAAVDRANMPYAQQVVLANLLGAASSAHWSATPEELTALATRLAESAGRHGAVCEATICRNEALTAYVDRALAAAPRGAELAAQYRSAIDRARQLPPAASVTSTATSTAPSTAAPSPIDRALEPPAPAAASAVPIVTGRVLQDQSSQPVDVRFNPFSASLALRGLAAGLLVAGWVHAGRVR